MELNRHDCTVFGIGAALGGLLTWAGSYIFFRKKLNQWAHAYEELQKENHEIVKIRDLKEEKENLVEYKNALEWQRDRLTDILNEKEIPESASDTGRDNGVLSRQQRDEIREKLKKNYEGTTNYATAYSMTPEDILKIQKEARFQKQDALAALGIDDIEEELAEAEHPEDDESYVDPREQEHEGDISTTLPESSKEADVDEQFKEHQRQKRRKPRIISVEEASNLPGFYESATLLYYATNEVLVTEDEEVVEDPELLIGDALTKYNFANNDEQRIFVMNYALSTCYEVLKILGSYEMD